MAKTDTWRYYSYDLWGNEKDGYEVNNVFRTTETIKLAENIGTDMALFAILKKAGFINKKYLRAEYFASSGDEETLYLEYKGRPEGEFRKEKNENKEESQT